MWSDRGHENASREDERKQVQAGLRLSDAFVLRRCQILLASDRGERLPARAKQPAAKPA